MKIRWSPRWPPLDADGVVAQGAVAHTLARRLLERDVSSFEGVVGADVLVVLGEEPPWADGACFIGREPLAPGLWLPTSNQPNVHPALVARGLRLAGHHGPVALLKDTVIPLGEARVIDRDRLAAWIQ
mgnify:CR=1 FL=1